jgi:uncharacterized protein YndB with AHSA1/START domain
MTFNPDQSRSISLDIQYALFILPLCSSIRKQICGLADVQLYRKVKWLKYRVMESKEKTTITVQTLISAPINKVWKNWTNPEDIVQWNNASADWHTPKAENDLQAGGKFLYRMEARDGSSGFDFEGIYDTVRENEFIEYHIVDGRKVKITFSSSEDKTKVVETFEAETVHSIELQQQGWQAILDNFKSFVEGK